VFVFVFVFFHLAVSMGVNNSRIRSKKHRSSRPELFISDPVPLLHRNFDDNNFINNNNNNRDEVKKDNYPLVPGFLLCNSINFNDEDIDISDDDQLSQATLDIIHYILRYMTCKELGRVQQCSKFFYKVGKDNYTWKRVIVRESANWVTLDEIKEKLLLSEYDHVKWKIVARDHFMPRYCRNCKRTFRKCENTSASCEFHSRPRDLVENQGVPSGVYWLCCLRKERDASGCEIGPHALIEERK